MTTETLSETASESTKPVVAIALTGVVAIGLAWAAKKAGKAVISRFKKTQDETV